MANLSLTAKEQGRTFYEEVVKPAMSKRCVVYECTVQHTGGIIYTIEDTVLDLPYKYYFETREAAERSRDECRIQKGAGMKTPKRTQRYIDAPTRYDDGFVGYTAVEHARWKRKNREKRLKCTIRKYKTGKGIFGAYSYLMSAYAIMLKIGELSKDASIAECRGHLIYLNSIMENLHKERERVLRRIDVLVDKACEREETEHRKEQGRES